MAESVMNYYEETPIKNRKLPDQWQSQEALDELAAFLQFNWEQRAVFFEDGEISSRQQFVGFTGQRGIRTNNYVGTIVFRGQQLNIFPKVFRTEKDDNETDDLNLKHMVQNLIQWISYCNKIEYPFINISSDLENSNDLRELFITLYVHCVKRALEYGPFYRYEEKENDLSTIRGHIDFKDYINYKIPYGCHNRFKCRYSEFVFDNKINRIIKYTCKSLFDTTTSPKNKKIINDIRIRLNEVSDVSCVPNDCDGIQLSKMHRQYAVIISMSKMFLLNQSSTYTIDNNNSFCFLFPTELLFEGFIGGFIADMLQNEAKVRLQASELTLISDIVYQGQSLGKAFTMRHDILVEHKDKGLFILDTKYKHMPRFEGNADVRNTVAHEVTQTDLNQMLEYAEMRGINSAYLLYPMYRFEDVEPADVVLNRTTVSGKSIFIHVVRIPFIFETDVEKVKKNLRDVIRRIIANV